MTRQPAGRDQPGPALTGPGAICQALHRPARAEQRTARIMGAWFLGGGAGRAEAAVAEVASIVFS